MGFFKKLVSGLAKTRDNIVSGLNSIFHGFSKIDDDFYEELEETLIMGDIGVETTEKIIEDLKARWRNGVTIYHAQLVNGAYTWNFEQNKENWEVNLL